MFLLDVAIFPSCVVRIFLRTLCGFDTPKILIRQTIRDGHKLIPHILVGGIPTPSEKSEFISWDHYSQYIYMEKIMFQTTNQPCIFFWGSNDLTMPKW